MRRILGALLISAVAASCRDEAQPVAGGKPLSHWKHEAQQVSFLSFWNSSKDERRREAFRRLSEIGEPAVPTLVELLGSSKGPVSGDAFNALANLGPRAAAAVPALISIARKEKGEPRLHSVWILGRIGPAAAPAVPILVPLLQDSDPGLRQVVAATLGQIGGSGTAALEAARTGGDARIREAAVAGMNALPLDSASRHESVAAALDDPDPQVRQRGVELLLGRRRNDAELPASFLVKGLNDPDERVSEAARRVLTVHLQQGRASQTLLAAVLRGADAESRSSAAWQLGNQSGPKALSGMDSHTPEVAAALHSALADGDARVRIYAARALAHTTGPEREESLRLLRRELRTAEPVLAVRAAQVLWNVRRNVSEVKEAYEAGLRDTARWTRIEAISAILDMGIEASAFLPVLEKMQSDPSPEVRERVENALHVLRLRPSQVPSR